MVVTAMDALTSFVYLTDHLPEWILQINNLSAHASQKHEEFVAEYARLVAQAKPKRQRSRSLRSLRTNNEDPADSLRHAASTNPPSAASTSPPQIQINPLEPGNKYLFASTRQKQKPGSSIRSAASGPQRFRSKHMAIIYYDSYLQLQLEGMVKNIGAARNNIRKGKMSRGLKKGLQLPSLSRHLDHSYEDASLTATKNSIVTKNSPSPNPKQSSVVGNLQDDNPAATEADKHLERAQLLCETAAHQFLRDGDCAVELKNARTKLEATLELARSTVEELTDEKEAEEAQGAAKAVKETEQPAEEISKSHLISSSVARLNAKLTPILNEKMEFPRSAISTGAGAIEVDDDSDASSIVVDVKKLRAGIALGVRS